MPIVYPEDNIDPEALEEKLSREREEQRLKEAEEQAIQQKHQNELNRQNEIDREREREQEKERLYQEELERQRQLELQNRFGEGDGHSTPTISEYLTTSTTVRPTKRRPSKPQDRICKLPVDPELDSDEDVGYRFGATGDSRIEFAQVKTNLRKSYEFSLQFKTSQPDGLLFYVADARHTDFIALYLLNGSVSILNVFINS